MKRYNKHITTLLSRNEFVILPGVGGFITKNIPARIDSATHFFYPPSKEIAFNDRLTIDDNKLVNEIAVSEGVSLEVASGQLVVFVEELNNALSQGSPYEIEGLGFLQLDSQGQIAFRVMSSLDIQPENYGLPTLLVKHQDLSRNQSIIRPKDRKAMSSLDLQQNSEQEQPNELIVDSTSDLDSPPKPEPKKNSLVWLYVATPLILLGIFGMFLGGTEDGRKMLASMHLIASPEAEVEETTEEASVVDEEATEDETASSESFDNAQSAEETISNNTESDPWANTPVKSAQETIAKTNDIDLAATNIISGKSGRCFVIVGGFSEKKNAVKLREKLVSDGMEAKVIGPKYSGDLYRVSLGDYTTRADATQKAEELKATYGDDLWVMIY